MNLVELTRHTNNEESAETYLRDQGILKIFEECPYCQSKRINRVRRFKYKCYFCHREWGVRRGSILEGTRVPFTKFLMAIKLFKIDRSVREAAKQLGVAYNTACNIHSLIRRAILTTDANASSFSGEIEMNESHFGGRRKGKRGRGAAGKVPVFGILERCGKVTVEVVTDV